MFGWLYASEIFIKEEVSLLPLFDASISALLPQSMKLIKRATKLAREITLKIQGWRAGREEHSSLSTSNCVSVGVGGL